MTHPRALACIFLSTLTATALLPVCGCSTNAATGRRQANFMSVEEEVQLGEQEMPGLIEGYGGQITDPEITGYVTNIGLHLASYTEAHYPELPWEFTLLDSEVINAFALPGGKVFVSRGLAEQMNNEAQLAGVLGHEIGHVTAEHIDKRMGDQLTLQIGAAVGAAIIQGVAGEDRQTEANIASGLLVTGAGVWGLSFSRGDELEADELGIRYMVRAGYNPIGQLQVMEILRDSAGSNQPAEWLSTHPLAQTRINRIERIIAEDYPQTQNDPAKYGTFPERFEQKFLRPMSFIPVKKPAEQSQSALSPSDAIAWAPQIWCAHCRDAASSSQ